MTLAEIIKTELDGNLGDYSVRILGLDSVDTMKRGVILEDDSEDILYTTNDVRIANTQFCNMTINESEFARRNSLYGSIEILFKSSIYALTIISAKIDNVYSKYGMKYRVRYIGGKV